MNDRNYKMPQCFRGQIVRWYESGVKDDSRACPAIVLIENHSSLHVRVFGIEGNFDKTCTRHVNDPNAKEYDRINEGGWDFTEAGPRLVAENGKLTVQQK